MVSKKYMSVVTTKNLLGQDIEVDSFCSMFSSLDSAERYHWGQFKRRLLLGEYDVTKEYKLETINVYGATQGA